MCLALEARRRAKGEDHTRIDAEEDTLKAKEEWEDLRLKAEEEARLAEGARLKVRSMSAQS